MGTWPRHLRSTRCMRWLLPPEGHMRMARKGAWCLRNGGLTLLVMGTRPACCHGPYNCRCGAAMSSVMVTWCTDGTVVSHGTRGNQTSRQWCMVMVSSVTMCDSVLQISQDAFWRLCVGAWLSLTPMPMATCAIKSINVQHDPNCWQTSGHNPRTSLLRETATSGSFSNRLNASALTLCRFWLYTRYWTSHASQR